MNKRPAATISSQPLLLSRQWLLPVLLGSAFHAACQDVGHFNDWC